MGIAGTGPGFRGIEPDQLGIVCFFLFADQAVLFQAGDNLGDGSLCLMPEMGQFRHRSPRMVINIGQGVGFDHGQGHPGAVIMGVIDVIIIAHDEFIDDLVTVVQGLESGVDETGIWRSGIELFVNFRTIVF